MTGDEEPGDPFEDKDRVWVQILSLLLRKLNNQGVVKRIGYTAATMSDIEEPVGHWYSGVLQQVITVK
jgi:hypothetical protein